MMDIGMNGQRVKDVLKDTKYENRYINSLYTKREELSHVMNAALNKKKKEIEGILEKNNSLEETLIAGVDKKTFQKHAENLTKSYLQMCTQVKELQKEEKDLLCEINEVLSEKENLNSSDKKILEELSSLIGKYKAISQLYINFLRLRWVQGDKLYGYVAINDTDFKRFEVLKSDDKFERVNHNWEQLEKCLQ